MRTPNTGPLGGDGTVHHLLGTDRPFDGILGLWATIEMAPMGIAQFDLDGRFLLVNPRLCDMLGYSEEALLTRTFHEVTFPEDHAGCEALNQQLAEGSIPSYRLEKRFVCRDGSAVWARVTVSAVRENDGHVAFFVGVAEDISESMAGEAARLEAEGRLRAALEASDTGTFRWDIRTGGVDWDENLDRLYGLRPGEAAHSLDDFLSRVYPDDRSAVATAIRRCAMEGADFEEEFRILRPDGSVRWVLDRGRTVADPDGAPLEMTGACTDITDQKRAEAAIRESESRFRGLVEASPLGILVLSSDGSPIFQNARAEELHGMTLEQAAGRGWADAIHPDDRGRVVRSWSEAVRARGQWSQTYRFRHAGGRAVWVSARAAPLLIDGHPEGFVGTLEDVTDLKLAEDAIRQSEARLEQMLVRERDARSEAELATRRRDEVLGLVAHDLRNPVHTITASASLLAGDILREDQWSRQLGIVQRSARLMDSLIQDLLTVSHLESGTFSVDRAAVDLRALLQEALELFEQQAREAGVVLECHVDPDAGLVMGDPIRLNQIISNLVGNAIKFTPTGGRVTVRAVREPSRVVIAVEDTGPGIPPGELPHIFDRFWQAESKHRAGAGLGLSISKAIAEAHGGLLEVQSTPGRGTTFDLTIPVEEAGGGALA